MPSNSSDTTVYGNPNVLINAPNGSVSLSCTQSVSIVSSIHTEIEVDGQIFDFSPYQLNLPAGSIIAIDGNQVISSPVAAIADPAATLVSLQSQLTAALNALRSHGLIQT